MPMTNLADTVGLNADEVGRHAGELTDDDLRTVNLDRVEVKTCLQ